MKKIYIQPITKYSRFEADTLLLDASQDEWADGKQRGFDTDDEVVGDEDVSWGQLW